MIRKAVIPAAGFGTRFLPAAKSQPKEMLPIVDKPTIQYVVEEAVAADVTNLLMITGKGKHAIEDHFDRNLELEQELASKERADELEAIRKLTDLVDLYYIRQKELRGLGDAILCAAGHVGCEVFGVLLGDTVIESETPPLTMLNTVYEQYGGAVLLLERVDPEKADRYGIIAGRSVHDRVYRITDLVEKPVKTEAPSNLAVAGRYLLPPSVFEYLDGLEPGRNNEVQLTDALRLMAREGPVHGIVLDGKRYDMGNKLDFLKTNIDFALRRPDLRDALFAHLRAVTG
jgi:UTP--glucose-1-phosphate uridylyltransferase